MTNMNSKDVSGYLKRIKRKEKRERKQSSLSENILKFKSLGISVSKINNAYLYVVENTAYKNWYKLGTTIDLTNRLTKYQTSDPLRGFCFKDTWLVKNRFELEKSFLRYATRSSLFEVKGEWIYAEDYKLLKRKIHNFVSCK